METQRNIDLMLVAKNVDRSVAPGTTIDAVTDLTDGEVVWVTPQGTVVDNSDPDAADYRVLRLLQRSGDNLLVSDDIEVHSIFHYNIQPYVAPVQKVERIGYDGVSAGSIRTNNNALYLMRLTMQGYYADEFQQQKIKDAVYKSGAAATQYDIAEGLVHSILYNFKNETKNGSGAVTASMLCSAAVTAGNCFDNDATVVQGSKYFTVATNVQYGGVAAVVGDYIRLQSPTASATALTDSVYRITAINTLTITVDRPIIETSGTYAAAGDELEVIPAATAQAADWGVEITGLANNFSVGKDRYWIVDWDTTLSTDAFGATEQTTSTAIVHGYNANQALQELEWFLQGNEGTPFRQENWGPSRMARQDVLAATSETYDVMRIGYKHMMDTELGAQNDSVKWLTIALAVTGNAQNQVVGGTNPNTCIVTVADDWIVTSWAIPGMSAQAGNLT